MKHESFTSQEKAVHSRLREICLQWPESQETIKWGHPVFVAGKKMFASFGKYDDRACIGFKLADERWDELVDDVKMIPAPYAARFGWVCYWVDKKVNWKQLAGLILDSYRAVALKRMLDKM